jgi:hypothetical protein
MSAVRQPLRCLLRALGTALGQSDGAVVGVPVALDLRWRHTDHGVFLSGVPADLIERVHDVFGASIEGDLGVVAEWWSTADGRGIGTGPVLVGNAAPVSAKVAAPPPESSTKSDQAHALRNRFARTVADLDTSLAAPPDVGELLAAVDREPSTAASLLADMADSRRLVGRYLLDAADELDDERVDQLGDGYVRAAELWAAVPSRPDPEMVRELLALERSCAGWMRGAAAPPTRYAF